MVEALMYKVRKFGVNLEGLADVYVTTSQW